MHTQAVLIKLIECFLGTINAIPQSVMLVIDIVSHFRYK